MTSVSPTRYLLDTNIIVHYIRGGELSESLENTYHLSGLSLTPIVSVVSEGEIKSLAIQFGWGKEKLRKLNDHLSRLVIVQLELPGLTDAYAEIDNYSRSLGGRTMGQNDLWIAATANVTGARLLTTDRDFDHLDPSFEHADARVFLNRDWIDPNTRT